MSNEEVLSACRDFDNWLRHRGKEYLRIGATRWDAVKKYLEQIPVAPPPCDFGAALRNLAELIEQWERFRKELIKECNGSWDPGEDIRGYPV